MLQRKIILVLLDIFFFGVSGFAYFLLNGAVDTINILSIIDLMAIVLIAIVVRYIMGAYKNILRYASTGDYLRFVVADAITICVAYIIKRFSANDIFTAEQITFVTIAALLLSLSARFVYKVSRYTILRGWIYGTKRSSDRKKKKQKVVIVGAGYMGSLLAKEFLTQRRDEYDLLYFIDTDKSKTGSYVQGIKVYSENQTTLDMLRKSFVDEVIIALPNIPEEKRQKIYNMYLDVCNKVQIYDHNAFSATESKGGNDMQIRDIKIEDLLFRNQQILDRDVINVMYSGKTILITGGGGSIGSEICRQIAKTGPKQIIILDIYENSAYDVRQELLNIYGDSLNIEIEIISITDRDSLEAVFVHYHPDIVFHAAAHKHVPLMEHNPREAVCNNVFGTYNVADMAEKYGVRKFIMVSTDKAVNPTNIMGATKRMCEMIVLSRTDSKTEFAAVRFGNVLGSNGSVIPLFKRQIASGGPITITDKRIIRYFMTIPEASQLVMYAGAIAKRSELFVLDMGNPVRIIDLAQNLIKLSGYIPYKDIDIVEIGLRPGEKLYEELLINSDNLLKTESDQIFIEKEVPPSREEVEEKMHLLRDAIDETRCVFDAEDRIKQVMHKVVPTYQSPEIVNLTAEKAIEAEMT